MDAEESSLREEVSKLMGQGKRHLVCNKVVEAVKCFEEATQKLENKYSSGADECGEAYLFYGKALLELARAENGVLGNAIKDAVESKSGESSDEDEDNMEAGAEPGEKNDKEGKGQDNKEEKADTEEKDEESKDKSDEGTSRTEEKGKDQSEQGKPEDATPKEEAADEEMKEEKEKDKDDEGEGGSKEQEEHDEEGETKGEEQGDGEEGENKGEEKDDGEGENKGEEEGDGEEESGENDEEGGEGEEGDAGATTVEGQEEDTDVPTMQLAWESLELAYLVFLRHDDKEAHLNLAEVHLKLGEIQLEQEQFVSAVTDFLKCLELQEKHLEPDDRLIAETAYNLGLAYTFQPNYSKAKEFYSKALNVIQLKTSKLEARLAESDAKNKGKGKATDDDPCVVDRKELQELQNLYPEIKARVDDAEEMMNSVASQQLESTTEEGFGSSAQDKSDAPVNTIPIKKVSSEQPANDVSHLMRRKRKPEEESSSAATDDTGIPTKKARQDEEQQAAPVVTENGHDQD